MLCLQKKETGQGGKKRKARASDEEKDESSAEEVLTKTKKRPKKVSCPSLASEVVLHIRHIHYLMFGRRASTARTRRSRNVAGANRTGCSHDHQTRATERRSAASCW